MESYKQAVLEGVMVQFHSKSGKFGIFFSPLSVREKHGVKSSRGESERSSTAVSGTTLTEEELG